MSDLRMSLVALLCTRSILSTFCWVYGDHTIELCSNLNRTKEQYSIFRVLTSAKLYRYEILG